MTISQKRAIWYATRERQLKKQKDYIKEHGLEEEFKHSKYKSMTWFLKSKEVTIY